MSSQEITQSDGLILNRVTIGEPSEKVMFELNLDWQEGASLVKLKKEHSSQRE